jgi:osmotically-inducible protein OsmY
MDKTDTIRNEVETALMNDDRTQNAAVDVISSQGFVTLVGEVESTEVAQAAEEIANGLEGVIKVINNLTVKD